MCSEMFKSLHLVHKEVIVLSELCSVVLVTSVEDSIHLIVEKSIGLLGWRIDPSQGPFPTCENILNCGCSLFPEQGSNL